MANARAPLDGRDEEQARQHGPIFENCLGLARLRLDDAG